MWLRFITVQAVRRRCLDASCRWRDRQPAAADDREPEHLRPHRGWPAVASLTLTVVGFFVATAVVIALARTSTARWEKARRAARVPRPPVRARRRTSAGGAARGPGTVVRKVVAMIRGPASLRASLKVAGSLATAPKQVVSRGRPFPRLFGILRSSLTRRALRTAGANNGSPASPVHDVADSALPLVPRRSRGARPMRRDNVPGTVSRRLFRRKARLPRRRARGFLHRHDRAEDQHVLHGDSDESPTAR